MSVVALSSWRPEEVRGELERLEASLRENLSGAPGTLGEVARSALAAGGKRMRPRLVFAAAGLCGGGADAAESCRPFAMAVEYLHTATLLHDDLVDGATLRRGEAPAYVKFGPKEAVLAGDLLLARCLALVTGESSIAGAALVLAKATERMAIGEALEIGGGRGRGGGGAGGGAGRGGGAGGARRGAARPPPPLAGPPAGGRRRRRGVAGLGRGGWRGGGRAEGRQAKPQGAQHTRAQ